MPKRKKGLTRAMFNRMMAEIWPQEMEQDAEMKRLLARLDKQEEGEE